MAVKYVCDKCGASMALASEVETVNCPVCRIPMAMAGAEDTGASVTKGATIPPKSEAERKAEQQETKPSGSHPPEQGPVRQNTTAQSVHRTAQLKVAKPVAETSGYTTTNTSRAIVEKAKQEAGEIRAAARKEAEKTATEIRRKAEEEKRAEIQEASEEADSIRKKAAEEARQKGEAIQKEALDKVEAKKKELLEAAGKEAEELKSKAAEEAQAEAAKEAEQIKKEAREEAEKIKKEASEINQKASAALEKSRRQAEEIQKSVSPTTSPPPSPQAAKGAPQPHTPASAKTTEDSSSIGKEDTTQMTAKKDEINVHLKREARFIMAGMSFSLVVLLFCILLIANAGLSNTYRMMTYTVIGLDCVLFGTLCWIIFTHYTEGKAAVKRFKERQEKERTEKQKGKTGKVAERPRNNKPKQSKSGIARKRPDGKVPAKKRNINGKRTLGRGAADKTKNRKSVPSGRPSKKPGPGTSEAKAQKPEAKAKKPDSSGQAHGKPQPDQKERK